MKVFADFFNRVGHGWKNAASKPRSARGEPPGRPRGPVVGNAGPCAEADALLERGLFSQALVVYQGLVDSEAAAVAGHFGQARAYIGLGQIDDACDSLEVALALNPEHLPALRVLADLRRKSDRADDAVALLRRALILAPHCAELHFELAMALSAADHMEDAMQAYRAAMELDPLDPGPPNNLGLIYLQQRGDFETAKTYFRKVLEIAPGHPAGILNMGLAYYDQGDHQTALALYQKGLETHPGHIELQWHEALALLSLGDYERGWIGYETRFARPVSRKIDQFPLPDWDGTPVRDGGVLVLAEQGIGDEIMFSSCLGDLGSRVDKVVLECSPRLQKLFDRSFPWVTVRGASRSSHPDWARAIPGLTAKVPIGSLPRFFRSSREHFPPHRGYLHADPQRVQAYRDRMRQMGGAINVGISWRAGTRATRGALRSIALPQLEPLLSIPGVRLVSLQHALSDSERAQARAAGIVAWESETQDLDEAAAVCAALDLVVTVANTTAHLAGSLGVPTWVLLNRSPDWRWLRTGERSPWYPSMFLFRPQVGLGWESIIVEAARRLAAEANDMAASRRI